MTRRSLMRFLAAAATGARSLWPSAFCASTRQQPFGPGPWCPLRVRSMYFALSSPYALRSPRVQILCAIEGTATIQKVEAVRVNDELIPAGGRPSVAAAGSYWEPDRGGLAIYVPEAVIHCNLSRFPEIRVLLAENDSPSRYLATGSGTIGAFPGQNTTHR